MSMFGRRALMTTGSNKWWLPAGVASSGVEAVYQPIGAASLTASYFDLSGNGNNAAPGNAPAWASGTGWQFTAGSSHYLTTGVTPSGAGWSIAVRYSNADSTPFQAVLSAYDSATARFEIFSVGQSGPSRTATNYGNQEAVAGGVIDGVIIDTSAGFYDDGSLTAYGATPAWGSVTTQFYIGCRSGILFFLTAHIQAIAIYNTTLTSDQVTELSANMAALTG